MRLKTKFKMGLKNKVKQFSIESGLTKPPVANTIQEVTLEDLAKELQGSKDRMADIENEHACFKGDSGHTEHEEKPIATVTEEKPPQLPSFYSKPKQVLTKKARRFKTKFAAALKQKVKQEIINKNFQEIAKQHEEAKEVFEECLHKCQHDHNGNDKDNTAVIEDTQHDHDDHHHHHHHHEDPAHDEAGSHKIKEIDNTIIVIDDEEEEFSPIADIENTSQTMNFYN